MPSLATPATSRTSTLERSFIYCCVGTLLAFGILVEIRSAFLSRRMGDLDCYLRGAWAARVGADMYDVMDDNQWHYNYPPFYAILLMPLADPPAGSDTTGYVPYWLSVALFYAANCLFLIYSAHTLARALEESSEETQFRTQPRFCRRWWALRLWPLLFCLPPAAQTLMRAQVNHLVLALLCLSAAGLIRQQRLRAGIWLAFAICIKVIPAFLLIYPVWKRDGRTLLGCAAGLFLGLVALPLVALGPTRTVHQYGRYADVFFGPLLGVSDDQSRQDELLGLNATDSVGIKNALHNWVFFRPQDRPATFSPVINWAYRLVGVGMTLLTLWPGTRGRERSTWFRVLQLSALIQLMALLSPICHLHYMIFSLPLVLSLMAWQWQQQTALWLRPVFVLVVVIFILTNTIPSLPGLQRLKDLCVPGLGGLPIWLLSIYELWRAPAAADSAVAEPTVPRLAA